MWFFEVFLRIGAVTISSVVFEVRTGAGTMRNVSTDRCWLAVRTLCEAEQRHSVQPSDRAGPGRGGNGTLPDSASYDNLRNIAALALFVGIAGLGQTLCILTGGIDHRYHGSSWVRSSSLPSWGVVMRHDDR